MEVARKSRSILQVQVAKLDDLVARHWRLAASDRERGYIEWQNEVKKVAKNIETYESSKQKAEKYRIK